MTFKIAKTFRAVASATRIPLKNWVRIVSLMRAALNAGYWEHVKTSLLNLMFERKPFSTFSALVATEMAGGQPVSIRG